MSNEKMPNVDELPNAFNLLELWSTNATLQNLPNPVSEYTDW